MLFKDDDLVAQGKYRHGLVPIAHGQQPLCSEGVRDGEVGQAKEHD
ncbi:hypothetical protein [Nonomuraea deserti]|nr:hypothetical protein [Nonomuraea deserti]